MVLRGFKVLRDPLDRKVLKALLVLQDHRDHREFRGLLDYRVPPDP